MKENTKIAIAVLVVIGVIIASYSLAEKPRLPYYPTLPTAATYHVGTAVDSSGWIFSGINSQYADFEIASSPTGVSLPLAIAYQLNSNSTLTLGNHIYVVTSYSIPLQTITMYELVAEPA